MTMGTPTAARKFTLLDGMILVASVAVGFGLLESWWSGWYWCWVLFFNQLTAEKAWSKSAIQTSLTYSLLTLTPFANSATVTMLGLRLRGPRPRFRRLARQPGWMACLASAFGLMVAWAFTWARYTYQPFIRGGILRVPDDDMQYAPFAHAAAQFAGFAVVVSWATLLVGRRWRAEASWVDRLGRLVGLAWAAMAPVAAYLILEYYL